MLIPNYSPAEDEPTEVLLAYSLRDLQRRILMATSTEERAVLREAMVKLKETLACLVAATPIPNDEDIRTVYGVAQGSSVARS